MSLNLPILAARFASEQSTWQSVVDFVRAVFDSNVSATDFVVWGAILLGITSGVLGCFMVLRRQSLLGDAIGHAVLPGVCIGFMVAGTKSTPALLAGALVFGLLAAVLIDLLKRTTNLKTAECMGVVFTGFYGLGIVLLKYIQNGGNFLAWMGLGSRTNSGQSGLDKFLFGQIVGINQTDLIYMTVIAVAAIAMVIVFWRSLKVVSFDESFAFSTGVPVRFFQMLMTGLLTVAIVISIQAVGVVLVAAMLVTPAATAYLLTDRLSRMVVLAAIFGAAAGVMGAFFSVMGDDLPTGAFMVLAASTLFGIAFLFSPTHGVLPRLRRLWLRRLRTGAENLMRTMYIMREKRGNDDPRFGVDDLAAKRQESARHVRHLARHAAKFGWIDPKSPDPLILTDAGLAEARRIVRNHRLWELFLTQEAKLASDHVHADAEYIEHVLPKDVLEKLERMLDNPVEDPHGRPIPG